MIAEFRNPGDIFHCKEIEVLSVEHEETGPVPFVRSFVDTHFQEAFHALFGSESL
jgi:hypothetical protein